MKNHTAPLMLLMACSLLASGCGGGSGADGLNSESSGTDGPSSEGSGTDALISGNGNSNTAIDNDIPIDPLVSNDAVESSVVCGAIVNEISYEIFNKGGSNDNDNGISVLSPVAGVGWTGTTFCDMDNSVGVTGISSLIPQAAATPDIDGFTTFADYQWAQSTATSIIDGILDESITRNLLVSNVPGYLDGSRAADWWALHDNENLYLRVLARNEGSSTGNNQLFRDSKDPRDDDSIDIFIDGDNSKGTSYDGINDFHITVPRIDDGIQLFSGPNSTEGLKYNYQVAPLNNDHYYEIVIDLASAGIVPGRPFGFEVQLNDDDNGGVVDARFGWFEKSGSSIADSSPSVFGTALLTSCPDNNFCGSEQVLSPSN